MKRGLLIALVVVIAGSGAGYLIFRKTKGERATSSVATNSPSAESPAPVATQNNQTGTNSTPVSPAPLLQAPIADFRARVTKKFFGTYVTPAHSPVSPERFTGYHTGADVEYGDVTSDVPVVAISDGTIVLSRTASGYGGVLVEQFTFEGNAYTAIYGHLRPSSLHRTGSIKQGEPLGVLGTAYSSETDGERRHLHFGIHKGSSVSILGYVQNQNDLTAWLDPLSWEYK